MSILLTDDGVEFTAQPLHEAVPLVRPKRGRRTLMADAIPRAYRQPQTWLRRQLERA